jgi:hypothetical protein
MCTAEAGWALAHPASMYFENSDEQGNFSDQTPTPIGVNFKDVRWLALVE